MNRHPWFLRLAASWSDGIRLCVAEGPASGRMMGYAYRNQANGRGILGRWIDRQFLHYPGWEGVRRRRACLERLISQAIDSLHADGREPVHLVDIAGGTADYVLGALEQTRTKAVTALCLDIANPSVEEGQRRAQAAGLANVRFQIGDAMNRASLLELTPRPDVVICSGFYELLTEDDAVRASLHTVAQMLSTGGRFIVSHQFARPSVGGVGRLFAGESASMKMRPSETIAELLRSAGFVIEQTLCAANLYATFFGKADLMDLGLYQLKYPVRRMISGVLPVMRNVPPDAVSWSILPVGLGTALCYYWANRYPWLLLLGPILILLRMFLATLDGLMAVTFGKSSPRGEHANRVPAEVSDVLLMLGIALSPSRMIPGLVALGICWLTTFTGLVGLSAGQATQSVGPVGQTDRLTALIVFSLGGFVAQVCGYRGDALALFLWWVCLGGVITIVLRLWRTFKIK